MGYNGYNNNYHSNKNKFGYKKDKFNKNKGNFNKTNIRQRDNKKRFFILPMPEQGEDLFSFKEEIEERIRNKFPVKMRNLQEDLYVFIRFIASDLTDFRIAENTDVILQGLKDVCYTYEDQIRSIYVQTFQDERNPHIELYITAFKNAKEKNQHGNY